MSRADHDSWTTYVAGEVARFYAECGGASYLWADTAEAARYLSRSRGTSDVAAFSGPWHIVRKHVTTEFRQWVEENEGTERLTLSAWRERQRAERAEVAFVDSAEYALGELSELRRRMAERDALIVEASKRGAGPTAIAEAIGLSRSQVHVIVAAAELAPVTPIRPGIAEHATEWRQLASGEWVEVF